MNLRSDKRQNAQMKLDFHSAPKGEAPKTGREGTESLPGDAWNRKPSWNGSTDGGSM
jgi:hypothetical protein